VQFVGLIFNNNMTTHKIKNLKNDMSYT